MRDLRKPVTEGSERIRVAYAEYITRQLNTVYEERARDRPCDRTTTYLKGQGAKA